MSVAEYLTIGGPPAVVLGILGFLLNAYLSKKKDDREEVRLDRESESGIVETTKSALKMVREEMAETRLSMIDQRKEHSEEIAQMKKEHEDEIARWAQRVGELEATVQTLKSEVAQLRGWR